MRGSDQRYEVLEFAILRGEQLGRDGQRLQDLEPAVALAVATTNSVITEPVQNVRRRRTITAGAVTLERGYGVTDLTADRTGAAEIARRIRRRRPSRISPTTYVTPPGLRTPPVCAPAAPLGAWPACATSPSAPSASQGTGVSPQASATHARNATRHPGHSLGIT
ncbi:hypothetical protein P1P68_09940 [Streptomyces scabiei]|uniref:hypothetical protein n=1 Tax=Streptomyces scabiei TaxID=1930 RepID=UPI00298FEC29|nr:hypothetical protein [Streptomyces scabiei]MDW8805092.1 hypothetical protein [Streptomyces scabiei]